MCYAKITLLYFSPSKLSIRDGTQRDTIQRTIISLTILQLQLKFENIFSWKSILSYKSLQTIFMSCANLHIAKFELQ